jgi:cell division protein FtsB
VSRGAPAGRGPRDKRGASRDLRSRAPLPQKLSPRAEPPPRQASTLTARAAILAVTVATVIVAIALPFKVWLSQRHSIDSLAKQNAAIALHVQELQKQDQRWQDPAYIEKQAKKRLHYVVPGQKSYVILGNKKHKTTGTGAVRSTTIEADGPWYSQLWSSMEVAGGTSSTKK